ncbi:MAG: nuclear transport factor 2 family protein [Hyphomonas sp.]
MHDPQLMKEKTRRALELLFSSTTPFSQKKRDITNYINPDKYIQHSPGLEDGLSGLMKLVEEFDQQYSGYSISIKRVFADSDFSVAHCHYRFGPDDPGKAIVEIFRFEDGLMVEHWDVIQDVPDTEPSGNANGNGMF